MNSITSTSSTSSIKLFEVYWLFINQPNISEYLNNDVTSLIFEYYARLRVNWWSFEDYLLMYKKKRFAIAVNYSDAMKVEPYIYEYDEIMLEMLNFSKDIIDNGMGYSIHKLIIVDISDIHSKFIVLEEYKDNISMCCDSWNDAIKFGHNLVINKKYHPTVVINLDILTPIFIGQPKRPPKNMSDIDPNREYFCSYEDVEEEMNSEEERDNYTDC